MTDAFFFGPVEIIQDRRLGLIETRVLIALYSFRGKNTDTVWPSRGALAQRTGYDKASISRAITGLVKAGWVERQQKRGPNTYKLTVPAVADQTTKTTNSDRLDNQETVTDQTTNSDRLDNETVTDPVTPELKGTNQELKEDAYASLSKVELLTTQQKKCPYQAILDLYHKRLPMLPKVMRLTPERKQRIRARWANELPDLKTWEKYFSAVSRSKFLTGRSDPVFPRTTPFLADIDFLLRPSSLTKIEEGKYHRE